MVPWPRRRRFGAASSATTRDDPRREIDRDLDRGRAADAQAAVAADGDPCQHRAERDRVDRAAVNDRDAERGGADAQPAALRRGRRGSRQGLGGGTRRRRSPHRAGGSRAPRAVSAASTRSRSRGTPARLGARRRRRPSGRWRRRGVQHHVLAGAGRLVRRRARRRASASSCAARRAVVVVVAVGAGLRSLRALDDAGTAVVLGRIGRHVRECVAVLLLRVLLVIWPLSMQSRITSL